MRRNVLILILLFLGLCSLGQSEPSFHIVGNLGGSLGGKLFLMGNGPLGAVPLGETMMTNGSFEFKGRVDSLMLAYIFTEEQKPIATLMLENTVFKLSAGATGIDIEGGEQQAIWNQYEVISRTVQRESFQLEQQMKAAYSAQNQMQMQALQEQYNKIVQEARVKQDELLKKYSDSPVSACVIVMGMQQLEYGPLSELYGMLGPVARSSFFGQVIQERLSELKRLEVGEIAPDFKALNLNNDTISLYGVAGKLKLIDFWASWCAPCRQENPNVRRIYEKYHEAGLEIIGFSLDTKKEDWARAIREDKLTWIQISDLKGGQASEIIYRYNVKGIPCTYLLDGQNRIIAKNLRGRDLEKKIEEFLK